MDKQIKEYALTYKGYRLKVLNIGATITEYSLNGHNICLGYKHLDSYYENELFAGGVVGRTAGRIQGAVVDGWQLPKNYLGEHNHHGNKLHLKMYDVKVYGQRIELSTDDPEGDYPGNCAIKIVYSLDEDGLTQEIYAKCDKPTLLNFTNHSYFNLDLGSDVRDHQLQIDANLYGHLDSQMFVEDLRDVSMTSFDFRQQKRIGTAKVEDDRDQFAISKFIDHPFKLDGKLTYSTGAYKLDISTTNQFVVIYAANYLGDCKSPLKGTKARDYGAICFETQKIPGDVEKVVDYYSKTNYDLKQK